MAVWCSAVPLVLIGPPIGPNSVSVLISAGVRFEVQDRVPHIEIGRGNSVAEALDRLDLPELAGTVAGDNTILAVVREGVVREQLLSTLAATVACRQVFASEWWGVARRFIHSNHPGVPVAADVRRRPLPAPGGRR